MDILLSFLLEQSVLGWVVTVLLVGWGVKTLRAWKQNALYQRAVTLVENVVVDTYEDFVRECKDRSVDGVLTLEEKKEAMSMALNGAQAAAIAQGVDLLKDLAGESLPSLIEWIIGKLRRDNSGY